MAARRKSVRKSGARKKSGRKKVAGHCRSLAEIRDQIDRIDRELMTLMAERSGFVRRAAELKTKREEILDPARIDQVVAAAKRQAGKLGLDPATVEEAFRAMIERFIAFEYREFDRRQSATARPKKRG
jgi:isochorismate pyruvate lyase